MSDIRISAIQNITPSVVREVLRSPDVTHTQKVQFMRNNGSKIRTALDITPTPQEYNVMMETRPLIKGRPIKNAITKRGDKILLAKTLGISTSEVDSYINKVQASLEELNKLSGVLPATVIDTIKTYIYRHGSADQLATFFNYELSNTKDILKTLYKTLSYNTGGVADYFIRPIHRMKNSTLVSMYNVIDKNLNHALKTGQIDATQHLETSEWALKRICQIQHNSKFLNAIKIKQYI